MNKNKINKRNGCAIANCVQVEDKNKTECLHRLIAHKKCVN